MRHGMILRSVSARCSARATALLLALLPALAVMLPIAMRCSDAHAITVRDDAGNNVTLAQPAQRIVTLAPHATELVFAAGAGSRIVGTVDYSDYPSDARRITRVGSNSQIDIERLVALKPDLLVVWLHGSAVRQLETLRRLGIPLFYSEPQRLADLPDAVRRLGRLAGTEAAAQTNAAALDARLAALGKRYAGRPPVRLFYQVWPQPLYTLNGKHIVSDAIRLCGGVNIFDAVPTTAPTVTVEAVLLENPEAIVSGAIRTASTPAGNTSDSTDSSLAAWRAWPGLLAVQRGNLFALDGDLLNRAGPRMIDGAAALCERLETARARRTGQEPR